MYSPKIREELVPAIYQAAKRAKVPMTKWVNEVIKQALWQEVNDGSCSPQSVGGVSRRVNGEVPEGSDHPANDEHPG